MTDSTLVEVTQADRDAAATEWEWLADHREAQWFRDGQNDDHSLTQAFAHHRRSTMPASLEAGVVSNTMIEAGLDAAEAVLREIEPDRLDGYAGWREYENTDPKDVSNARRVVAAAIEAALSALSATKAQAGWQPVKMILHCPRCHLQHVDEPDERTPDWDNPTHRSHLCHGCGCIWRPADVATEGVRSIETTGKADNWPAPPQAGDEAETLAQRQAREVMNPSSGSVMATGEGRAYAADTDRVEVGLSIHCHNGPDEARREAIMQALADEGQKIGVGYPDSREEG